MLLEVVKLTADVILQLLAEITNNLLSVTLFQTAHMLLSFCLSLIVVRNNV